MSGTLHTFDLGDIRLMKNATSTLIGRVDYFFYSLHAEYHMFVWKIKHAFKNYFEKINSTNLHNAYSYIHVLWNISQTQNLKLQTFIIVQFPSNVHSYVCIFELLTSFKFFNVKSLFTHCIVAMLSVSCVFPVLCLSFFSYSFWLLSLCSLVCMFVVLYWCLCLLPS